MINNNIDYKKQYGSYEAIEKRLKEVENFNKFCVFKEQEDSTTFNYADNLEELALRVVWLEDKSYKIVKGFMDLLSPYGDKHEFVDLIYALLSIYETDVALLSIYEEDGNYVTEGDVTLLIDEEKDDRLANTLSILKNLPNKDFLEKFVSLCKKEYSEIYFLNEKYLLTEILNYEIDKELKKSSKYTDIIDIILKKQKINVL